MYIYIYFIHIEVIRNTIQHIFIQKRQIDGLRPDHTLFSEFFADVLQYNPGLYEV